jgi:hypothetical protein
MRRQSPGFSVIFLQKAVYFFFLILYFGGCGPTNKNAGADGKYHDPLGFAVRLESGWKSTFEKGAYIQVANADQSSRGVVFPFMATKKTSAENCLAQVPATFTDILPQANLVTSRVTKTTPDEAIAEYSFATGKALGLCSIDGLSGVLFLAISPDGVKSESMKKIIATLQTVTFEEPGQVASDDAVVATTEWLEPNEKAYRLKVPTGWKVEGGLFRFSAIDVRSHVRITSPDDEVMIGIGDKDITKFTSMPGAVEGSTYNPGGGTLMTVKRFQGGQAFASEYATTNAALLGCPGAQATGNDLPELSAKLQQVATQNAALGIGTVVSAGEASVSCEVGGKERVGYIFAVATLTTQSTDGSGTWEAFVTGFKSPKARESEARSIASAIVQSIQLEPTWFQAQQATTAATSQIVAQTGQEIAAIFRKSAIRTQAAMDRVFRNWSNATLGQTDVVDKATGETYKIAGGKNYYWRKTGTNVIAGTNQYERPDIDFKPLLEY